VKRDPFKPIDVLLLAKNDWANTGYRFWRCLLSLGLNAVMFKGNGHAFGYPNQAPIHPSLTGLPIDLYPVTVMTPYLESLLAQARVVHFIASTFIVCPTWQWGPDTKVVVQHGGSTYRLAPERSNAVFNPLADATIIQCPDLLGLGAKNEHLVYYPVDVDKIRPDFEPKFPGKLIVGHFPSDPTVKGTAQILEVIRRLEADPKTREKFGYQGVRNVEGTQHWVGWEENLDRMAACDVIIETINPEIAGKKFGEWGNTTLEASALGKIVVTNTHAADVYAREYGTFVPRIANDAAQLEITLRELILHTDERRIDNLKRLHRQWVETNHSMEATAKRLWDKVYRHFFE
jgi:hypothetical protein